MVILERKQYLLHFSNSSSWVGVIALISTLLAPGFAVSDESTTAEEGENASNPLAAVDNTDLRWQYFDLGSGKRQDFFVDGTTMLSPKLKLKYELHYWDTDVTGRDETDWESVHLRLIHFPMEGKWGDRPFRLRLDEAHGKTSEKS